MPRRFLLVVTVPQTSTFPNLFSSDCKDKLNDSSPCTKLTVYQCYNHNLALKLHYPATKRLIDCIYSLYGSLIMLCNHDISLYVDDTQIYVSVSIFPFLLL